MPNALAILVAPAAMAGGAGHASRRALAGFDQLQVLLVLGVLLVCAVVGSPYLSLGAPLTAMFSVPVTAIGVAGALKLTSTSFGLQAYIGVTVLAGIVGTIAILPVDYTNVLRRRNGKPVATIQGLVPMSLGFGEGFELQAPLALRINVV